MAFYDTRYTTCERLLGKLETLIQQITSSKFQPVFTQKQSLLQAEQLRIQELQLEFYERSNGQLSDLLKQAPKRTQLNRLGKFL